MTRQPQSLPAHITAFLAQHSTLTLATVGPEGQPQAAALFFAADEDGSLVFVSGAQSRHSLNLEAEARAAVTVHNETWNWQAIAGVQMEGRVHRIPPGLGREQAWEAYRAKFPFVAEFEAEVARSEFYRFVPEWVRLIDNSVRFGFREEFSLGPDRP
jgi:uncharacterized protein YhbP (UPF0306 family)